MHRLFIPITLESRNPDFLMLSLLQILSLCEFNLFAKHIWFGIGCRFIENSAIDSVLIFTSCALIAAIGNEIHSNMKKLQFCWHHHNILKFFSKRKWQKNTSAQKFIINSQNTSSEMKTEETSIRQYILYSFESWWVIPYLLRLVYFNFQNCILFMFRSVQSTVYNDNILFANTYEFVFIFHMNMCI